MVPIVAVERTIVDAVGVSAKSKIVSIGQPLNDLSDADRRALVNGQVRAVFPPGALDPELASAVIQWLAWRVIADAYPGRADLLRYPDVRIVWSAWNAVPAPSRGELLDALVRRRVLTTINGARLVRPTLDLPLLRWFSAIGRRDEPRDKPG